MTQQIMDTLIYEGKRYPMPDINNLNLTKAPWFKKPFERSISCCWRGYVATWLIQDNQLFLDALDGAPRPHAGDLQRIEGDHSRLYPLRLVVDDVWDHVVDKSRPSFCDWYSGEFKVGIEHSNSSYIPIFEDYILFSVEKGAVINIRWVSAREFYEEEAATHPTRWQKFVGATDITPHSFVIRIWNWLHGQTATSKQQTDVVARKSSKETEV